MSGLSGVEDKPLFAEVVATGAGYELSIGMPPEEVFMCRTVDEAKKIVLAYMDKTNGKVEVRWTNM